MSIFRREKKLNTIIIEKNLQKYSFCIEFNSTVKNLILFIKCLEYNFNSIIFAINEALK